MMAMIVNRGMINAARQAARFVRTRDISEARMRKARIQRVGGGKAFGADEDEAAKTTNISAAHHADASRWSVTRCAHPRSV